MEQQEGNPIVQAVERALKHEPRVDLGHHPLRLAFDGDVLTMDGELEDISAKKLALEIAASVPNISGIVDRLRVEPAQRLPDERLLPLVADALLQEPALQPFTLTTRRGRRIELLRARSRDTRGFIEVRTQAGVVTLDGEVSSLAGKRLAGVLAWWVPGTRDVVNGLGLSPPEEDNDEEITDAVSIVLSKDPFVNAGQLRVHTHRGVVTLEGLVHSDAEREMAEYDAWYVFGVDRVENHVRVVPRLVYVGA